MGFIIMEPEDTPPMSGSNCICVATVLLDTGILPMTEPETRLVLEAPAGLVEVVAQCRNGKAQSITLSNVPAFADRLARAAGGRGPRHHHGRHRLRRRQLRDGGCQGAGLRHHAPTRRAISPSSARKIVKAANEQLGFVHPDLPDWTHFSFAFLTGALERVDGCLSSRNACVVKPGKIDRSPTGTGCSALMAVLHAKGLLQEGERYIGRSIIESRFIGEIAGRTTVGNHAAIIPTITGRAWITGQSTLMLDPDDPWPDGYKISDTWPMDVKNDMKITEIPVTCLVDTQGQAGRRLLLGRRHADACGGSTSSCPPPSTACTWQAAPIANGSSPRW